MFLREQPYMHIVWRNSRHNSGIKAESITFFLRDWKLMSCDRGSREAQLARQSPPARPLRPPPARRGTKGAGVVVETSNRVLSGRRV